MPIGGLLEHVGGAEEAVFVEGAGLHLEADGEAGFCEAAGEADAGEAGEVGGDGVQVFEVHRERVVGLFTEFEGGIGGSGADDEIDVLEGRIVVAANEAADL